MPNIISVSILYILYNIVMTNKVFNFTNYFVLDPMKRILARNILEWKMIISKTKKDLPGECLTKLVKNKLNIAPIYFLFLS